MSEVKWTEKYYSFLVGAKVTGVSAVEDEEGWVWPTITIEKDGQTFELEVGRDPEGNGPGFLFGLPSV